MSVTLVDATNYSMNRCSEIAFEVTYSDGTKVRAVESKGSFIRAEYLKSGKWEQSYKPYIVVKNKKRNAERIKDSVIYFLNGYAK